MAGLGDCNYKCIYFQTKKLAIVGLSCKDRQHDAPSLYIRVEKGAWLDSDVACVRNVRSAGNGARRALCLQLGVGFYFTSQMFFFFQ